MSIGKEAMSAGDSQPSSACPQRQFIGSLESAVATTASNSETVNQKVTLEAFSY
jgi:hypothetical protein